MEEIRLLIQTSPLQELPVWHYRFFRSTPEMVAVRSFQTPY